MTGVRASTDGGDATVTGQVTTPDEGFWFVQYGSQPGNYTSLEFGGG